MRQHSRTPASGAGFTKAISRSLVPSRHRSNGALPAAVPMDKWISRRRSLRPRNPLPAAANRIALPRANAEVAGSMWVIGRTDEKRPFITHIVTHKKAPLGRAFSGAPWPDTDASKRRKPASMLVMQGVEAGRWRRAERPRKVANRPPSTPGMYRRISIYAVLRRQDRAITHIITHIFCWLRVDGAGRRWTEGERERSQASTVRCGYRLSKGSAVTAETEPTESRRILY